MNLLCKWWGHSYRVTRRITAGMRELKCARCGREFAMHDASHALLPLDDELREAHDAILGVASVRDAIQRQHERNIASRSIGNYGNYSRDVNKK